MNTGKIKKTKTLTLPKFPATKKNTRVVTKHFTNLALYLPQDQLSLLSWLIYQCRADNTIIYKTTLLRRYRESIKEAGKFYSPTQPKKLHTSLQAIRAILTTLIQDGYLLSSGSKTLLINPLLTYRADYITKKEYEYVCNGYQNLRADETEDFITNFTSIISSHLKPYTKSNV